MITMMNLINMIPDHIGWVLVGVTGTLCALMAYKLAKVFVEMYKDWREDLDEDFEMSEE